MTAQISDTIQYQGKDYELAGINGDGLFDPFEIGIKPVMLSTACYRGFYCRYKVQDAKLFLKDVTIQIEPPPRRRSTPENISVFPYFPPTEDSPSNNPEPYDPPKIYGCVPSSVSRYGEAKYLAIDHRIEFTGGLILANDFINELYDHMGFQQHWKYRDVHELIFVGGQLVTATDKSVAAEEYRQRMFSGDLNPSENDLYEATADWIIKTFDRRYDL